VLLTCTYISLYVMVGSVWFSRLGLGSGTRHLQRWMVPRIETFVTILWVQGLRVCFP
jgi:hypothetical protein